jgi:hypothetical protein
MPITVSSDDPFTVNSNGRKFRGRVRAELRLERGAALRPRRDARHQVVRVSALAVAHQKFREQRRRGRE